MTHGSVRTSAIALGAAAFAILSPLAAAEAAVHHSVHATHVHVAHASAGRVAHRSYGRVARAGVGHRHYVWRNGHRYAYGYGYGYGI